MACKVAGLIVLVTTLVISCVFVGQIGVGMPDEYLVLDSSYLYDLTRDFESLTASTRTTSVSMLIEHLDIASPAKLAAFMGDVMAPLNERDDVYATSCMPALYSAYAAFTAAQSQPVEHWSQWLNASAVASPLFGRSHYGEEIGQFSGLPVPRAIVCTITGVGSSGPSSTSRIDIMNWYLNFSAALNAEYADTCFPCDATRVTFYAKDWALKVSDHRQ